MPSTQHCKHCGAPFQGSRAGYTVHCPEHRAAASRRAPSVKAPGREYRVYFERRDGIQGEAYVIASGYKAAMRAARERIPMGATIRGIVEA